MESVKVHRDISNEGLGVSYEISELDSTKDITSFLFAQKCVLFIKKMWLGFVHANVSTSLLGYCCAGAKMLLGCCLGILNSWFCVVADWFLFKCKYVIYFCFVNHVKPWFQLLMKGNDTHFPEPNFLRYHLWPEHQHCWDIWQKSVKSLALSVSNNKSYLFI